MNNNNWWTWKLLVVDLQFEISTCLRVAEDHSSSVLWCLRSRWVDTEKCLRKHTSCFSGHGSAATDDVWNLNPETQTAGSSQRKRRAIGCHVWLAVPVNLCTGKHGAASKSARLACTFSPHSGSIPRELVHSYALGCLCVVTVCCNTVGRYG